MGKSVTLPWLITCTDGGACRIHLQLTSATVVSPITKSLDEKKAKQATARKAAAAEKAYLDPVAAREVQDDGAVEAEDEEGYVSTVNDSNDDMDDNAERGRPKLHPDDLANFFKLSSALKLILALKLSESDIQESECLIWSMLCVPITITPPMFLIVLVTMAPLHGFWTFLFECIDRVLKISIAQIIVGASLKLLFFREFHQTTQQSRVMASSYNQRDLLLKQSIKAMYNAAADNHGTV
ncbi:hypothetical protein BT96DRAFT_945047 [Gymnopus androsaceus JB14]|uniref:Uncharacterized protein n=1 Tax=Gymnopus androsaceus JB14 TaxID=1447944 RepID=A0A6A4H3I9_9AGAR|nr:hypothetical protein BT96DRAFT_945047 [Gymnopus androsaceus JB14]